MRIIKLLLLSFTVLTFISSCDENKNKVEKIAKQFADAVNNKDKATIQDLFPESKDMPNMSIVDRINYDDIFIEYDDSLKEYEVFYGKEKNQSLEFQIDSMNNLRIIDSYHIYKLDSAVYELALKTGVPINKYSDVHLCDLMKEDNGFINGLSYSQALKDILKVESVSFDWNRYDNSPTLYAIIKNMGKKVIKGDDYKIEFFLYYRYTNTNYLTLVADGKDISSGGRERIQVLCDGVEDVGDISNNTYVEYRLAYNKLSLYEQLLKYGDWNGGEYNLYLEVNKKMDENDDEMDKLIDFVSKQKLTDDNLKNLLPINLKLLRNCIYAKHGYVFKDKDIRDYFMNKPWYKEKTNDMKKISAEFNEIEKFNVDFIKEYEKSIK